MPQKPKKRLSLSEMYFGKGTRKRVNYYERFNLIQQRVKLAGWKRILASPKLQEAFAKRYKLPVKDVRYLAKTHVTTARQQQKLVNTIYAALKGTARTIPEEARKDYLDAIEVWVEATRREPTKHTKQEQDRAVQTINSHLDLTIKDKRRLAFWKRLVESYGDAFAV